MKRFIADWASAWREVRDVIDGDRLGGLDRWDASVARIDARHFVPGASCGAAGAFSRVRSDRDPETETVVDASVTGDRARIRTEAPDRSRTNRKTHYVYSLIRSAGEWRIAELTEDTSAPAPVPLPAPTTPPPEAPPLASSPSAITDDFALPYPLLLSRSLDELKVGTDSFDRLIGIRRASWEFDQDTGRITFSSPIAVATAPAQIAGSFDTADNTWLWAWQNPSVEPRLTAHARLARQYGERNGVVELTTAKFVTTEDKCWELAALTMKLGKFQGAYRGPTGSTRVFITFGELTIRAAQ